MGESKRPIVTAIALLSVMLGATLLTVAPVRAAFAATAEVVDASNGSPSISVMSTGSTFTVQVQIRDADDMDSWGVTINYYSIVLTAINANYTSCGGYTLPRTPTIVDDVGDGVRGQVELGETYFTVPAVGFTGSCVLAYIDFQVDDASAISNPNTLIHITIFKASSVKQLGIQTAVVPMPVGLTNDAHYGGSSVRYVDLVDSPISKRCAMESHHYRWSLTRDGDDGKLTLNCILQSIGNSYPVVARVRMTITDLTINAQFGPYDSKEVTFTGVGQTASVKVDKGALSDDNSDLLVDLALNHNYLVNSEAQYDCRGDTATSPLGYCSGSKDRVFTFTVKA